MNSRRKPHKSNRRLDDLTIINGIGPVYQEQLRQGGLSSFRLLADATPEQVRATLKVPEWRKIEPESWIEQAKRLANE